MQLRAQLRRTPCQMYRATSASESSGGRLPRAEVAFLYGSDGGGFPVRTAQRGGGSFAPAVVSAMASTSCERPTVLVAYMWNS